MRGNGAMGNHTLRAVQVVVAILDGGQSVVDDLFVKFLLVATLCPSCSEAITELGHVSRCAMGAGELRVVAHQGNLIPVVQFEIRNLGLLGGSLRGIHGAHVGGTEAERGEEEDGGTGEGR